MNLDWLVQIIGRFPKRTRIRIVGAEPTTRTDLDQIIRRVREAGHTPILLSNGLKLANEKYLERLRSAGLRTVYLSMNGGLDDQLYEEIDELACADRKIQALENACRANMLVAIGMILIRGVNQHQLKPFFEFLKERPQVRDLKLRSVGDIGRYQDDVPPLTMAEMVAGVRDCGVDVDAGEYSETKQASLFRDGHLNIHCTSWPPSNTLTRGRLTQDGRIAHFFEHVQANEYGY